MFQQHHVIKTLTKKARRSLVTVQDGERQEVHCWTWCHGDQRENDTLTLVSQLVDLKMDTVGGRVACRQLSLD